MSKDITTVVMCLLILQYELQDILNEYILTVKVGPIAMLPSLLNFRVFCFGPGISRLFCITS